MSFELSETPLDCAELTRLLQSERAGAFVSFEGWVRDHNDGREVLRLEYESYWPLAIKEGRRIMDEAMQRHEILAARCVHRVGALGLGEMAVWVGVTAAHRGPAFDACRFIIDEIKGRVPIWKREHYADGTTEWVNCATGEKAANRG